LCSGDNSNLFYRDIDVEDLISIINNLCLLLIFSFVKSLDKVFELLVVYWLSRCSCSFSIMFNLFAVLFVGAFILLITGLMGMLVSCSFSRAFSLGGVEFFWSKCLMCLLLMILSHCFSVFWIILRSCLVGSLATVWKLF
jgi:hypothetical protein